MLLVHALAPSIITVTLNLYYDILRYRGERICAREPLAGRSRVTDSKHTGCRTVINVTRFISLQFCMALACHGHRDYQPTRVCRGMSPVTNPLFPSIGLASAGHHNRQCRPGEAPILPRHLLRLPPFRQAVSPLVHYRAPVPNPVRGAPCVRHCGPRSAEVRSPPYMCDRRAVSASVRRAPSVC